ncbi:hypothetical protein TRVA0_009S01970 [Trichomonascus vanleenenianus]|uniref:uncharacterized protein n=1 Tax=Trichomonascus vanleenenianus TaxID=2268995 RepID=UPI003ECA8B4C
MLTDQRLIDFEAFKNGPGHRSAPVKLPTPPYESIEDGPTAIMTSFDRLVDDIKAILGPSSGIDSADVDVDDLMDTMRQYQSSEADWAKYALQDLSRNYTRNGVDDINKKANLLILVWNPCKGSMIHDHANAHCIVKLLKGRLTETLYEWPEDADKSSTFEPHTMKVKREMTYHENEVSYMSDQIGLHRMYNPDPHEPAISLHLYTPPYASKFGCHVFDETTGKSHKVDLSTLYSDKGVKITHTYSYSA